MPTGLSPPFVPLISIEVFSFCSSMPTAKAFSQVLTFPDDVPVYELPRLTLRKLISNYAEQSKELFHSFREHGVALLDMQGSHEGESFLNEAEKMFEITRDVTVRTHSRSRTTVRPPSPISAKQTTLENLSGIN